MKARGVLSVLALLVGLFAGEARALPIETDAAAAAEACGKATWPPNNVFARPSAALLCMLGDFTRVSLQNVHEITEPDRITSLVINSGGGWTEPAIELAKIAERHHWLIIVKDKCLSSCANYVFLSRTEKVVLPQSVVGWHGLPKDPSEFDLSKFEKEKAKAKLPPEWADIDLSIVLSSLTHSKEFLAERGISLELCRSRPQVGHSAQYVARLEDLAAKGNNPFWSYGRAALEKKFNVRGIRQMWEPRTPEEGTALALKRYNANIFFFDLSNR